MGKVDQGFVALWIERNLFGGPLSYTGYGVWGVGRFRLNRKDSQVRDVLDVADLARLIVAQMAEIDP